MLNFAGLAMIFVAAAAYPQMAPVNQYLMDRNSEIALARSAAPASVSSHATVLVLAQHGYEEAVAGTNGFVCMVDRSWLAPFTSKQYWNPKIRGAECLSRTAARTVVPVDKLRTKMVLDGASTPEIVAAIRAAFADNSIPALAGGMCYMMSKDSYLNDAFPQDVPHVMFWVPTIDGGTLGATIKGSPVLFASYWPSTGSWAETMKGIPPIGVFLVGVDNWSDGTKASVHL